MPRTKRRRPNWPYRFAWLAMLGGIVVYIIAQTLIGGMTYGRRSYGTDWGLALVASCLDATFAAWFVAVGASIGSFLNVVAFRLPRGRNVGGHSGCFYCQTPIRSSDNVPVLAWIKLRGRCRTCRLPLSIQYPLVEFGVAMVFLFVYMTEISRSGANLPGAEALASGGGLLRMRVTTDLVARSLTYLLAISGLIAAALIAVRRQVVPLKLFMWTITPWLAAALIRPELVIVGWRQAASIQWDVQVGWLPDRLEAITTIICGMAAAMAVARLLTPLLYPNFDRRLLSSDAATRAARQFLAAMGVAGGLMGWQAVVPLAWVVLLTSLIAIAVLHRFRESAALGDLVVWLWLGLVLFRASWRWLIDLGEFFLPATAPAVTCHIGGAVLLAPLAILIRRLAEPRPSQPEQLTQRADLELEADDSKLTVGNVPMSNNNG
ncbi:MAG: prepilin peptidase [Pirellulaceae bacterium]